MNMQNVANFTNHFSSLEVQEEVAFGKTLSRFLIALLLISCPVSTTGEILTDKEQSRVGIAFDKKSCSGYTGGFWELPLGEWTPAKATGYTETINQQYGTSCKIDGLILSGFIGDQSLGAIQFGYELIERRKEKLSMGVVLWLNSPGGLVNQAMKIGDFIATKNADAIVTLNGKCFSSCVLILAAAATRGGIGDVGIHRPFAHEVSTKDLTYGEYLKAYDGLTGTLRAYLTKYGVSPGLVDQMNVVASDDIRILTLKDREGVGLGFQNIAHKEFEKARTIQVCGQEYFDLNARFFATIDACRTKFGITPFGDQSPCWELAETAMPNFHQEVNKCNALKSARR